MLLKGQVRSCLLRSDKVRWGQVRVYVKHRSGQVRIYVQDVVLVAFKSSSKQYFIECCGVFLKGQVRRSCQNIRDTAKHTIFTCDRWTQDRWKLKIGLEVEKMIKNMLVNEEKWNPLGKFVNYEMNTKKKRKSAMQTDNREFKKNENMKYCRVNIPA